MSQSVPARIGDAAALLLGKHTVRCPQPGCTVRIRYRAMTPEDAERLIALATDHTRH
ncbi:hypothetical protein AB0953_30190 [Streptomyces sp. NPDC046866]|uniref:hypothetical protein n=1 Tax=Streptomyces sp. NPDC046866 TaxID=3154921 RepID=UPI0034525474